MKDNIKILKRVLSGLDRLEESGAPVNLIRADITTVMERLDRPASVPLKGDINIKELYLIELPCSSINPISKRGNHDKH